MGQMRLSISLLIVQDLLEYNMTCGVAEIRAGDQKSLVEIRRKRDQMPVFGDLACSWIFLVAMFAEFAAKIVEIRLYIALS